LDINATIAEFALKTWGFLVYPDDYDEETNPFELLMKRILHEGIIPVATSYFQSFFVTPGPIQQVYCHRYREFVEHLKAFSGSWRLTERLVGIRIKGLQVEVLFYPLRRSPNTWEVGSLSTIADFSTFGLFKQGRGSPSAEFFENMNHICYMWMTRSDGVYSPPDSPESSLSDLFGSTTGTSSIASVADGVARARVDDDSVEMDTSTTSVHVDLNGTMTSIHLGPDSTINSIRRIFSSYTDCQPVLFKNRFCLNMGENSTAHMAASGAYSLGFSPTCTERAVSYVLAPYEKYGDGMPVQRYAQLPPVARAYYAKGVSIRLMKQAKGLDPLNHYIGIGSDLRNWMPDTGASFHFTPCLLNLQ
jgi:hypothetical protein